MTGGVEYPPSHRIWTARALVKLGAVPEERGEAARLRSERVDALRRQVREGTHHIDADRVSRAMLLALGSGGI